MNEWRKKMQRGHVRTNLVGRRRWECWILFIFLYGFPSLNKVGSLCFFCCKQLPQANPGFNSAPFRFTKYSNAYMLVYIRESDKEKIMCSVDEKDIAEHLRVREENSFFFLEFLWWTKPVEVQYFSQVRFKKEQELKEHRRKEKFEAHLYTIIKVFILFFIFIFIISTWF